MIMQAIIAILGSGNMGVSIASGLIANGYAPQHIWMTDRNEHKLTDLQSRLQVQITCSHTKAIQKADIVILAVKPQQFKSIHDEVRLALMHTSPLIISIAAGISVATLETLFGDKVAIIRCMPNTPTMVGFGASALFANNHVTPKQKQCAEMIFNAVGVSIWLDAEALIDVITSLSGSGPAYYFLMMETMQKQAMAMGLSEQSAHDFVIQTALGAAQMAKITQTPLEILRENVTSKNGATEKGLAVFEQQHFSELIQKVMLAVQHRSQELALLLE
jgi:pyrroline-5-carboxylate reductase